MRGRRLLTARKFADYLFEVTSFPSPLKRELKKEWEDENWCFLADSGCPNSMFQTDAFASLREPVDTEFFPPFAVELFLKKSGTEPELSTFERLWKEIIQYPVIPFNLDKRREVLAKAYNVLQPYLEFHEANKPKLKPTATAGSESPELDSTRSI